MAPVLTPACSLYEACTIKLRGLHNSRQKGDGGPVVPKVLMPVIRLTSFKPTHLILTIYSSSTLSGHIKVNKIHIII